jgi:predicted transcriptional regulator
MPCLMPDGTLSRIGVIILSAALKPSTLEQVAETADFPLFRTRSAIRGLVNAGLLENRGDLYALTPEGMKKLTAKGIQGQSEAHPIES